MKYLFLTLLSLLICHSIGVSQSLKIPAIGIVSNYENDSLLHANGYGYIVESISRCFSPRSVSDVQFQQHLERFRKLKTKLYAVNIFMPGDLKVVGPEVAEEEILLYAEEVFKRCQAAQVTLVIWGSGGARRIPEGFDRSKANEQFAGIAKKISAVAKKYNVVLALENLNSSETNFITTLEEALEMVQRVNHPHFRLCADIYHMMKEGESPQVILKTQKYLVHCDIAEKENRTPPGTQGDNFTPYLSALKAINYSGKIMLECRWENLALQARPSYDFLLKKITDVYNEQ